MSLYTSRLPPLSLPLIKSFRYLLQDSPKGFFLTDEFIGGLKFLGEKGWAFDMTLDTRRDLGVLEDAVECIMRVRPTFYSNRKCTECVIGEGRTTTWPRDSLHTRYDPPPPSPSITDSNSPMM